MFVQVSKVSKLVGMETRYNASNKLCACIFWLFVSGRNTKRLVLKYEKVN